MLIIFYYEICNMPCSYYLWEMKLFVNVSITNGLTRSKDCLTPFVVSIQRGNLSEDTPVAFKQVGGQPTVNKISKS